jgi:hypothetical protein
MSIRVTPETDIQTPPVSPALNSARDSAVAACRAAYEAGIIRGREEFTAQPRPIRLHTIPENAWDMWTFGLTGPYELAMFFTPGWFTSGVTRTLDLERLRENLTLKKMPPRDWTGAVCLNIEGTTKGVNWRTVPDAWIEIAEVVREHWPNAMIGCYQPILLNWSGTAVDKDKTMPEWLLKHKVFTAVFFSEYDWYDDDREVGQWFTNDRERTTRRTNLAARLNYEMTGGKHVFAFLNPQMQGNDGQLAHDVEEQNHQLASVREGLIKYVSEGRQHVIILHQGGIHGQSHVREYATRVAEMMLRDIFKEAMEQKNGGV